MLERIFLDVPLREGRDARGQQRPREADDGMHCGKERRATRLGVASAGVGERMWR